MNIMEVFDRNSYLKHNIDSVHVIPSSSNNDSNNSKYILDVSDDSEETHNQFWKTKLCLMFSKGICRNGSQCKFAHGSEELRTPVNLKKTKLCPFWLSSACDSGENCPFAHGTSELRVTNDYYKTSVCRYWKMGVKCDAGVLCRHAHGETELRRKAHKHLMKKRTDDPCYTYISSAAATAAATMAAVMNEGPNLSGNNITRSDANDSTLFGDNNTISNRLLNIPQIPHKRVYPSLNTSNVPYNICDMGNMSTTSTASSSNSSINAFSNPCSTLSDGITNKIKRNYSHDGIFKNRYELEEGIGLGEVGSMEGSRVGGFRIIGNCFGNGSNDNNNNYNAFQLRNSFSEQNLSNLNSGFFLNRLEPCYCPSSKSGSIINPDICIGDWKLDLDSSCISSKDEYNKTKFLDLKSLENNRGDVDNSSNLRRVGNSSNSLSSNISDNSLNDDYFGTIWDGSVSNIKHLSIQQQNLPIHFNYNSNNINNNQTLNLNQQLLISKLQQLQLQHKQQEENEEKKEKENERVISNEGKKCENKDNETMEKEHYASCKYSEENSDLQKNISVQYNSSNRFLSTGINISKDDNGNETGNGKDQKQFVLGDFLENCPNEFKLVKLDNFGAFEFNSPVLVKLSLLDNKELSSISNGEIPALIIPSDKKLEAARIHFISVKDAQKLKFE
ncbi:hypothetical protein RS030_6856 [Cryptosporidium xiaoi]|uniref:C3H1-type domain-containing protein n=1 Tax=Cryptosporidium xiaoi TaxID=659607 RepID=A0AAV9Y0Z7_9CRYT